MIILKEFTILESLKTHEIFVVENTLVEEFIDLRKPEIFKSSCTQAPVLVPDNYFEDQ
jgi:hypothetical protein